MVIGIFEKIKKWYENEPKISFEIIEDKILYEEAGKKNIVSHEEFESILGKRAATCWLTQEEGVIMTPEVELKSKKDEKEYMLWKLKSQFSKFNEEVYYWNYVKIHSGSYYVFFVEKKVISEYSIKSKKILFSPKALEINNLLILKRIELENLCALFMDYERLYLIEYGEDIKSIATYNVGYKHLYKCIDDEVSILKYLSEKSNKIELHKYFFKRGNNELKNVLNEVCDYISSVDQEHIVLIEMDNMILGFENYLKIKSNKNYFIEKINMSIAGISL